MVTKVSYEIALRWMPLDLTADKSTLVQVMAWCRQATSHYLSRCWPRSMSPNGVTRPQWVTWTLRNKFLWNQNEKAIFVKENEFKNVGKMGPCFTFVLSYMVNNCSLSLYVKLLMMIKLLWNHSFLQHDLHKVQYFNYAALCSMSLM